MDEDRIAATVERCRELVAATTLTGAIAEAPGIVLELRPRSWDSVDVELKGVSPNGTEISEITRLQHVAELRHAVLVDAAGQGWTWGDFLQERDEPDLTEDAQAGIDDALNERISSEVARLAVDYALANPLAMSAATVLNVSEALGRVRTEETRARARAEVLAAQVPALVSRLAREIERCEAVMEPGADAPSPGM